MFKMMIQTLIVALAFLSNYSWAANYSNPIDGIFKGTYGSTISVEVPSLVSKSPVDNEDQNGDLSFQLNPATAYKNFNQLTDLKPGDSVRVEYNQDPTGKIKSMIADTITRLEPVIVADPVEVNTASTSTTPDVTQTVTTTTTRVNAQ